MFLTYRRIVTLQALVLHVMIAISFNAPDGAVPQLRACATVVVTDAGADSSLEEDSAPLLFLRFRKVVKVFIQILGPGGIHDGRQNSRDLVLLVA